jgi:hypothetical protein
MDTAARVALERAGNEAALAKFNRLAEAAAHAAHGSPALEEYLGFCQAGAGRPNGYERSELTICYVARHAPCDDGGQRGNSDQAWSIGELMPGSFQRDLALNLVRESDAAERDGGMGGEFFVALELAFRQALADCLLDLALGGHAQRLEEFADAAIENVLVHGLALP